MMNTQVDGKSVQQNIALAMEPLRLWCVMSPWNNNDSEEGTFEEKVWAADHDDACRALANRMADEDDSGCETDEDRSKWVVEHLEATEHLMVVLPVSESVKDDIRELLQGPDGEFDAAAKADFDAIMAILAKR